MNVAGASDLCRACRGGAGRSPDGEVVFDDGVAYQLGWKPMFEFTVKEGEIWAGFLWIFVGEGWLGWVGLVVMWLFVIALKFECFF